MHAAGLHKGSSGRNGLSAYETECRRPDLAQRMIYCVRCGDPNAPTTCLFHQGEDLARYTHGWPLGGHRHPPRVGSRTRGRGLSSFILCSDFAPSSARSSLSRTEWPASTGMVGQRRPESVAEMVEVRSHAPSSAFLIASPFFRHQLNHTIRSVPMQKWRTPMSR